MPTGFADMKITLAAAAILAISIPACRPAPAFAADAGSQLLADHIAAFQKDFAFLLERGQTSLKGSSAAADANDLSRSCTLAKSSNSDFSAAYDRTDSIVREIEATGIDAAELKSNLPEIKTMVEETDKLSRVVCSAAQ
jgi:hypothetical protein